MIKEIFSKKNIFSLLILFGLYCSLKIGIIYDEFFHIENGESRLRYLLSLGYYDYYYTIPHLKYYPGFYDTLKALITSAFPKSIYYEVNHVFNFLVGLSGLVALKKFVKFIFNKKTSDIFFILSFFTPVFFGHLGFNPKDTIIAAANFWILYYSFKYLKCESKIEKSVIATKIGIIIGIGAGVRIIFLATLIPLIIFFFLEFFFIKKISRNNNSKNLLIDLTKSVFVSYFIVILCWPDVHQNIFFLPINLFLEEITSLDILQGVQVSYFAGSFYETSNTPWYYIIFNLFYKLPVFLILLFLLSLFYYFEIKKIFHSKSLFSYFYFFSIFLLIVPIMIAIFLNVKIHDGLRYFLFLIPIFNILPSIFLYYLLNHKEMKYKRLLLIFLSPFFIYFCISFITITPYHYAYLNLFNKLLLKDNPFENDYWGSSIKELVKNFVKVAKIKPNTKIASCGLNDKVLEYYLKKNGINNYIKTDMNSNFDYAILINRAIYHHQNNGVKNQTCFQKFENSENLYILSKNSIVLSKIIKY